MEGQVGVDAGVDYGEFGAGLGGKGVDGGAAVQKVLHHLRGDFGGVGGHAFRGDKVVAGEDDDLFAGDLRDGLAGDAGQLHGQGFQAAQAAGGLGQDGLAFPGGGHSGGVQGRDGGDGFVNQPGVYDFRFRFGGHRWQPLFPVAGRGSRPGWRAGQCGQNSIPGWALMPAS